MTLSVASQPINRIHGISEQGRLVLGLIDGGLHWLDWAIDQPRARYHFEDERALVAGVQAGLHATRLALLPRLGLLVSPVKLLTLSVAELRTLTVAEAGKSAAAAARVKRIFADHDLAGAVELAEGDAFLKRLGVEDAPLFQCMTLEEQLAILDLSRKPEAGDPTGTPYQAEATAFARTQSRTPIEFVDYYRAYHSLSAGAAPADSPEQRTAQAEAALATLLPILLNALDCPRLDGLPAPWEVSAAIEEWLMMGRRLGFSRVSQGARQVSMHGGYAGQTDEEAERMVAVYLAGAQALLMSTPLGDARLRQDGSSAFSVRSPTHEAVVVARTNGIITLSSLRRRREAPAASVTSKGRKGHGKA